MFYESFSGYKEMCPLFTNLNKSTIFSFIRKDKLQESVWNKFFIYHICES